MTISIRYSLISPINNRRLRRRQYAEYVGKTKSATLYFIGLACDTASTLHHLFSEKVQVVDHLDVLLLSAFSGSA